MAPEVIRCPGKRAEGDQLRADIEYGPKADVWSVGVLAYEILCCEAPFADKDRQEQARRTLEGKLGGECTRAPPTPPPPPPRPKWRCRPLPSPQDHVPGCHRLHPGLPPGGQ